MIETFRKLALRREVWLAAAVLAALGALGIFIAIKSGLSAETLRNAFNDFIVFIRHKPLALFLAIVLLPALPVPISPMLVAVGFVYLPIWGAPLAFLYGFTAVVLNMSWVWWVAAYPGRRLAARLLERFDVKLDDPDKPKARIPLLVFLRVTPGFPFFLQNILLGFLRVPFVPYIMISAALNSVFTFGFIVLPGAMMDGRVGLVLAGVGVVALGLVGIRWIRTRMAERGDLKAALEDARE